MFYFKIIFRENGGILWDCARTFHDLDGIGKDGDLVELHHEGGGHTSYSRHDFENMFVMSKSGDTLDRIRGTLEDDLPADKRSAPDLPNPVEIDLMTDAAKIPASREKPT